MELKRLSECFSETTMFDGRPNRDTIISQDDINNLIISLNTTETVNEFLRQN